MKGKSGRKDEEQAQEPGAEAPGPRADAGPAGGASDGAAAGEGRPPEGGGLSAEGGEAGAPGEPAVAAGAEAPGPAEPDPERVAVELEQCRDRHLRLLADFENYKKRVARERAEQVQYGNEALLRDLLPVIDNLERVLAYSFQEGDWKDFQRGVEMILAEIHKALSGHGVAPLEVVGGPFDPNLHEAMQRVETDESPPDTVVKEFQKGYLLRDRLLRPSLVAVAVPATAAAEPAGQGEGPAGDGGAAGGETGGASDG